MRTLTALRMGEGQAAAGEGCLGRCWLCSVCGKKPGAPLQRGKLIPFSENWRRRRVREYWEWGTEERPRRGAPCLGFKSYWDAVLVPVAAVPKDQPFESLKTTGFGSPGCCVPMCLLCVLASVSILITGTFAHNHLLTC